MLEAVPLRVRLGGEPEVPERSITRSPASSNAGTIETLVPFGRAENTTSAAPAIRSGSIGSMAFPAIGSDTRWGWTSASVFPAESLAARNVTSARRCPASRRTGNPPA